MGCCVSSTEQRALHGVNQNGNANSHPPAERPNREPPQNDRPAR